ncbi:MAG: hypothetical protein R6U61_07255 [Thermoplasmata archaeon]
MKTKKYVTLTITSLLLITTVLSFGMTSAEGDEWKVRVDEGETEALGGGRYRLFRFGSNETGTDARFGVVWGTEESPNSIVMMTTQSRYLGVTDVYDNHGKQLSEDKPIKAQSMLGVRVGKIYEYDDANGDGMCNFTIEENEDVNTNEEIFKYVDLKDAEWESSELVEEKIGDNTTWEFSLTAENLTYYDPQELPERVPYPGMENESLEYVTFTFHITAGTKSVEGVEIPQFNVTVKKFFGRRVITNVEKTTPYVANGVIGAYDIKWDHEIHGWDFQPENENPALIMGFQNMFGNHMDKGVVQWARHRFMHRIGEEGKPGFEDKEGYHRTNLTDPKQHRARLLRQNRIEYGGNWSKAGRFQWVSNVDVDGEQTEMHAQLMGGFPMVFMGPRGRNFIGHGLYGGMNYPGGENIYHDPEVSGSSYLELGSESAEPRNFRGFFVIGIFVAVGVVAVVSLLYKDWNKETINRNQYDVKERKREEDWSDLYDRD